MGKDLGLSWVNRWGYWRVQKTDYHWATSWVLNWDQNLAKKRARRLATRMETYSVNHLETSKVRHLALTSDPN